MVALKRMAIGLGIVGFLFCALTVLFFNRQVAGWQALSVPTGSMRPTMSPGSLVLVHRVSYTTLKVGDVITYTNPLTMKSTLTHRIMKITKLNGKTPGFITKGDANPSSDPPVVAGLVQGRAIWHVPFIGMVLMWSKTWLGIALLVYVPALLIFVEESRRLADYWRETKPYHLEDTDHSSQVQPIPRSKLAIIAPSVLVMAFIVVGWGAGVVKAQGGAQTNMAMLSPNILTAAPIAPPPQNCSNNTQVNVHDSSTQSVTSGKATSQNGSATSGNATNSNSTTTNVQIQNGCS